MININKIVIGSALTLVIAMFAKISVAGIVTIFDDLNFVTYKSGTELSGFYHSRDGMFSCGFLFHNRDEVILKSEGGVTEVRVMTFDFVPHSPKYTYEQRDPRSDIEGTIYLDGDKVSLKTDSPHGGCQSAAGMFDSSPGERGASTYSEVRSIDAIGIFAVGKKTFLYNGAGSSRSSKYLLPGDLVVAIRRLRGYVFVRFVNPDSQIDESDSKRVATGWVRSADLVDPFPPAVKH